MQDGDLQPEVKMRVKISLNQKVYEAIKAELMAGNFQPGERLEARELARRYNLSTTPVRMALARMAAERLVETWAFDGFHAPLITESYLYDLYSANSQNLKGCVRLVRINGHHNGDIDLQRLAGLDSVAATEYVFSRIASGTGNREMAAIIDNLSERLRLVRGAEIPVLPAGHAELVKIAEKWQQKDLAGVVALVREYHDRRYALVRELVSRMTRKRP